jgi:hypothetical protein
MRYLGSGDRRPAQAGSTSGSAVASPSFMPATAFPSGARKRIIGESGSEPVKVVCVITPPHY